MKKLYATILTFLMAIVTAFCFTGCSKQGAYKLTSWKLPLIGTEITIDSDSESFLTINLEDDGVVTVSGKLAYNGTTYLDFTTPQTGDWENGEDKNTIEISAGILNVTATVKNGTMTFSSTLLGTLTLKK